MTLLRQSVQKRRAAAHPTPLRVLAWPAENPSNPYIDLLYHAMRREGVEVVAFRPWRVLTDRFDVWHLHWPDDLVSRPGWIRSAVRGALALLLIRLARLRGTRLAWTAHNLRSHARRHPRLEDWFGRALSRELDGVIALTKTGREAVRKRYPALDSRPMFVVPHGHYRAAYTQGISRSDARRRLGLAEDATVLVSIGRVRGYKNLPALVRAFRAVAEPSWVLLIAGDVSAQDDGAMDEVVTAAAGDARVRLIPRYLAPEDVSVCLRAANLSVLPYRRILNSGSALLALSMDVPVLVPAKGAMIDLQEQAGVEWVRTYAGDLTPNELSRSIDWAQSVARKHCSGIDALEWPAIARATLEAFRQLEDGSRARER